MINNIYSITLANGVYDDIYLTRDVTSPIDTSPDKEWTFYTVLSSNFNGNINAGNVNYIVNQLSSFKIKRRKKGTFEWATLKEFPVVTLEDLLINMQDFFCANWTEYEYAFVPVISGNEGDYVVNSVESQFNGVFIADIDNIYKFYANVNYGAGTQVQKISVFEPFGRKYPVVVSNSLLDYYRGSFSGSVLPTQFIEDRVIDRVAITSKKTEILKFLVNKKAKVLKDWNGNIWLLIIVGNPTVTYRSGTGMGIIDLEAEFVQVGDAENQTDLFNNGVIVEVG